MFKDSRRKRFVVSIFFEPNCLENWRRIFYYSEEFRTSELQ